jgi:ferredoxin-NADP reductase
MPLQLRSISYLTPDTNLYRFESVNGRELPGGEPGSHIGLHLPGGIVRQYSLVTSDGDARSYVVGVKRDANGRGGSAYMHEQLRVGAVIQVEAPRNNFPLDEQAEDTILFAGGIGITPIHNMATRLSRLGRRWKLYYACRSRADAALGNELSSLGNTSFHFDDEAGGHMDIAKIVAQAPAGAHLYCCGPAPMLAAFEAATAGWPAAQTHVESFAPRQAPAAEGCFTVDLAKSGKSLFVPKGSTILQVLRDNGVSVISSCERGVCAACETRVIAGIPDHRDSILSKQERAANKTMFVCCSGSQTPTLVLDL